MKTNSRKIKAAFVAAAIGGLFITMNPVESAAAFQKKNSKKEKGASTKSAATVKVQKSWELPSELKEVSGIAWAGDNRIACVQDELGKIFVYNTEQNKIEKEIRFASPGDYEGITLVGSTAYVVRSNGKIYEVGGYNSGKPSIREYETGLGGKQNIEALTYDRKGHRLLLGLKSSTGSDDYKSVYAFDLSSKRLYSAPVYRIENGDAGKKGVQPSGMAIQPGTGDVYVLDGEASTLIIMSQSGSLKKSIELDRAMFPQPEGISFTPQGALYISNEGAKGPGTIHQVTVHL
jgi:uncharacterized protein YjiK